MERRASARSAPRKRYTVDAFEGIPELQEAALDAGPWHRGDDSESADDFDDEIAPDEADQDEYPISGVEAEEQILFDNHSELGGDRSDAGEIELDDGISIAGGDDDDGINDLDQRPYRKGGRLRTNDPSKGVFNRALPDYNHRATSKQHTIELLFGGDPQDWARVKLACEKWEREGGLPGLRKANAMGEGGFHYSFWQGDEGRAREQKDGWRWYFEQGGQGRMIERQSIKKLSADDAKVFVQASNPAERALLIGPISSPKLFKLGVNAAVSLDPAWQLKPSDLAQSKRPGFVLNLAARVKCLEWAPNQTGDQQYLAISTLPEPHIDPKRRASAYVPQRATLTSVQIWAFATSTDGGLDTSSTPVLSTVLCTDWGVVKALKWCPCPRQHDETAKSRNLGLLAGIWADGSLRVLDVTVSRDTQTTTYLQVASSAFVAHPPNTVFTTLTWLSSTRLCAATANGCIAVFTLPTALASPITPPTRPDFYAHICTGYILTLTSCYPSHPHMVLTSSTDGFPRLTDLSCARPSTHEATVQAPRSRTTVDLIAWHEFSQAALIIDDSLAIKSLALRRFFTSVSLGRGKAAGTALATSPCHPFVLWGTTKGDVVGVNPMPRVRDKRIRPLHQTWFSHEWRCPAPSDTIPGPDTIGSNGLSRFVEGFKVEEVVRDYHPRGQDKSGEDGAGGNSVDGHTIFEEETAVTALAWNPNLCCGSWAAAGMGDGLVRVEDLVPV